MIENALGINYECGHVELLLVFIVLIVIVNRKYFSLKTFYWFFEGGMTTDI